MSENEKASLRATLTRLLLAPARAHFQPIAIALRNRAFASYSLGNLLSFVGAWMQRVILGWLVWELTHSGLWLGVLVLCDLGPALIVGPIGGVLGDRLDQGRLILASQVLVLVNGLALAALAASGQASAPGLIGLAALGGVFNALGDAARLSIVRQLTTGDSLAAAVALTSVSFNLARFLGPVLGGALLATLGAGVGFAVAALMSAPFAYLLLGIGRLPANAGVERVNWLRAIGDGIAYVSGHANIARYFTIFFLSCLLVRPAYEVMPGIVGDLFAGDVADFSAMITAIGLGAFVAAINLSHAPPGGALDGVILRGSLGGAISLICLALAPSVVLAWLAAVMLGYFISTNANGALIAAQIQASSVYQARVTSLWTVIVRSGPAIGALLIGWVADSVGFRWPVLVGAALCAIATVFIARSRRKQT